MNNIDESTCLLNVNSYTFEPQSILCSAATNSLAVETTEPTLYVQILYLYLNKSSSPFLATIVDLTQSLLHRESKCYYTKNKSCFLKRHRGL